MKTRFAQHVLLVILHQASSYRRNLGWGNAREPLETPHPKII